MIKQISILILGLSLSGFLNSVLASGVTIPNTFTSGTPAVAAEVNGNFGAVKTSINDNDSRITALETVISSLQASLNAANAKITTLQSKMTAVQANSVLSLDGNLIYTVDANGYATAQFTGVNVQVINGVDQTTANGLGNLIVGYNNARPAFNRNVCSDGQYTTQTACQGAGQIWAANHKTGSHNLVAGDGNSYSQTGGVVFGSQTGGVVFGSQMLSTGAMLMLVVESTT